jgi:hypothetical protein
MVLVSAEVIQQNEELRLWFIILIRINQLKLHNEVKNEFD